MSAADFTQLGFIGLGVMGEGMCRNLVAKGRWPVMASDLSPEPVSRLVELGATAAPDAAAVAEAADVIMLCLPGGAQVEELVLGAGGLMAALRPGQILIDHSTSPPALARRLAAEAAQRGAVALDAPIARTRQAAWDGTLAIMVGAEKAAQVERVRPVLETMGTDVVHCGGPGAGQAAKILNNMVLFETVMALAEARSIAVAAGFDPARMFEVMTLGSGDSFALRNHGLRAILPDSFPDRAFSVRYAGKDLSYARALAAECGVATPGADALAGLFEAAAAAGDGDLYFPVIARHLGRASRNEETEG